MTPSSLPPKGVYAAAVTPFGADLQPDLKGLVQHCRWLLGQGCAGLAPFGTTGEGTSLGVGQKHALYEGLAGAGLPVAKMIPGLGVAALADAVALAKRAVTIGYGGVLVLPAFYYKNPSEEGVYAWYAELIERVADHRLRVYIYHFPQQSAVPVARPIVARLIAAYPQAIVGLKDSGGDWENSRQLLADHPGFQVMSGSEQYLLANLRAGGAGCISATVNLTAPLAALVAAQADTPQAEGLQEQLTQVRVALQRFPFVAAMKEILAEVTGTQAWRHVLPPLRALAPAQVEELLASLNALPQAKPWLAPRAQAAE